MDCVWSMYFRKERNLCVPPIIILKRKTKKQKTDHHQTAQNMGKQCSCRGASIAVLEAEAEAQLIKQKQK